MFHVPLVFAVLISFVAVEPSTSPSPRELERFRIQEHLDGALDVLRTADTSKLTTSQRQNREQNLTRLQWYRDTGVFPTNDQFPGARVPLFRDGEGVLCAMGFLLWETGETELVERIAQRRNTSTLHHLADEPGLGEWLTANGMSLEEAARVQPQYDFQQEEKVAKAKARRRWLAGGGFLLLGIAFFVLSARSSRRNPS